MKISPRLGVPVLGVLAVAACSTSAGPPAPPDPAGMQGPTYGLAARTPKPECGCKVELTNAPIVFTNTGPEGGSPMTLVSAFSMGDGALFPGTVTADGSAEFRTAAGRRVRKSFNALQCSENTTSGIKFAFLQRFTNPNPTSNTIRYTLFLRDSPSGADFMALSDDVGNVIYQGELPEGSVLVTFLTPCV